jgi:hypothetical protein
MFRNLRLPNTIDKKNRYKKKGKEAKNRVNGGGKTAGRFNNYLINGYQNSYEGEGEYIRD